MSSRKHTTITLFKVLFGLALGALGMAWSFYSLVRLGFLRHGNISLSFLHLDWIFQPGLPYWGAHMSNLLKLVLGIGFTLWVFSRVYRTVREWWAARQSPPSQAGP